ncbi:MAG: hypothetical protein JOY82_13940 [Streptosporangiaceae bacterium]|nr:hypothetical protein [Streptosporangiaceae bacterium]
MTAKQHTFDERPAGDQAHVRQRRAAAGQASAGRRWPVPRVLAAGMVMTCAAAIAAATGTATAIRAAATTIPAGKAAGAYAGNTAGAAGAGRGELVSATPLRTLPGKAAVKTELASDGFSTRYARYGVRTYRLVYRTVDAKGRPTTASGLLALPIGGPRVLTAVSFTHGTENYRGDAPSMQPSGWEPAPVYTYASAGFAAAAPDYLGLGTGPGLQPWMDVPSETTTTLDMLRAARGYLTSHGGVLRRRVMVTGFSQGASAALGLARALEDRGDRWFRLGALAPISGAYDFQGAELPALLSGELVKLNPNPRLGAKISVIYAAFTLVGFNRVHHVYSRPGEVFAHAYAGTIERLFDGHHTGVDLFNGTPATLDKLLTAHGFALLRHPAGGLATALKIADGVCTGWAPSAPARLYMATRDEQAVNASTWHCRAQFKASHRPVPVINLGTPDYQGSRHYGSNVAGTAQIVRWFLELAR